MNKIVNSFYKYTDRLIEASHKKISKNLINVDDVAMEAAKRIEGHNFKTFEPFQIGDISKTPTLKKLNAERSFRDIFIDVTDKIEDYGRFDGNKGVISINESITNDFSFLLITLKHELRHAADWVYNNDNFGGDDITTDYTQVENYYNRPTEIKSFAGEVAEELFFEQIKPNEQNKIIEFLQNSEYSVMYENLKEESRKTFFQYVYSELHKFYQKQGSIDKNAKNLINLDFVTETVLDWFHENPNGKMIKIKDLVEGKT